MVLCLIAATLLGLFAGLAPGPYTTMVAATGFERGFRVAVPVAMAPLLTDLPPLVTTALIVRQLDWAALTVLGLAGGVVVGMIGLRLLRGYSSVPAHASAEEQPPELPTVRLQHVLAANLLNPAPWVFWFVAGAPVLLILWNRGWELGALFLALFFAINVGSAMILAWVASRAGTVMAPVNRRRAMIGAGTALTVAGALMIWQAMEGNFQMLIDGQSRLRGVLKP